jgi:DNA-binding Lrp family transcriptional regulator
MSSGEIGRTSRAFVFLSVDLGREERIMKKLSKLEEVEEVHVITGEKDLIVVLEIEREVLVPDSRRVSEFVRNKIAMIHGVKDTETLIPTNSMVKKK